MKMRLWAAGLAFAALATGESFDSAGVPIVYSDEGMGAPVILVHGLYSSANINWRLSGTIRSLAPKYRVISFDLRGHGRSGKPEAEDQYGIQMAEDVIRLMDHLHIAKAHIVGYSLGGMITMKLVTTHPDRFRSAALDGMGWFREGSGLQEFWSKIPDNQKASRTPNACLRSLGRLVVTEAQVRAIRLPVEAIVGERDPCRLLYVAPLQKIRPDWPVVLVPDCGHLNCVVSPKFKDAVVTWLARQSD